MIVADRADEPGAQAEMATVALGGRRGRAEVEALLVGVAAPAGTVSGAAVLAAAGCLVLAALLLALGRAWATRRG